MLILGKKSVKRKKKLIMVVKVYGSVKAACPQRVLACLLEKGVDFEIVQVDLDEGEHKRPEFLLRQVKSPLEVIREVL